MMSDVRQDALWVFMFLHNLRYVQNHTQRVVVSHQTISISDDPAVQLYVHIAAIILIFLHFSISAVGSMSLSYIRV